MKTNDQSLSGLGRVKDVYSFWGHNPFLYDAQDLVTFMGRARRVRGDAVKSLKLTTGGKALEVACGTGRNFPYLMKSLGKEGTLTGFDYTQEMLDAAENLCRRNSWDNVSLIQGDAAILDVGENEFDGVLCVLGMSAIPNWKQAIVRCREVLKPGGILSVCDARLFTVGLRRLNPLVRKLYTAYAAWNPDRNIPRHMQDVFGNVVVRKYNLGTFFIAVSIKNK